MKFFFTPAGNKYSERNQSGIEELSLSFSGLRVVVCRYPLRDTGEENQYVEYVFTQQRGFRLLDEGDLLHYWEGGNFPRGHHLFEIQSGGWVDQELKTSGALTVTMALGACKEWFIVSTDLCLSVLSDIPPLVRELR